MMGLMVLESIYLLPVLYSMIDYTQIGLPASPKTPICVQFHNEIPHNYIRDPVSISSGNHSNLISLNILGKSSISSTLDNSNV